MSIYIGSNTALRMTIGSSFYRLRAVPSINDIKEKVLSDSNGNILKDTNGKYITNTEKEV